MTAREDAIKAVRALGGFSASDASDVVDAVEPIIRERIAQEIEAVCRMQCVRGDDCSHEQDARIARESK